MEKMDEADMALKQALKFGLTTQETWPIGYSKLLVEQVAALYYKQGLYSGAASILIRGLETSRAPSLNQRLGEVYIADNELSLAADALAEVHPIPAPPARAHSSSGLTGTWYFAMRVVFVGVLADVSVSCARDWALALASKHGVGGLQVVDPAANASDDEKRSALVLLVEVSRKLKRSRETRQYEDQIKALK
jgi:hypothetical protein